MCVCVCVCFIYNVWLCFDGISTLIDYLMPNPVCIYNRNIIKVSWKYLDIQTDDS